MKLLLTSGGITNQSMVKALGELTEKPFDKLNLVFIPTAANLEEGDKSWLIDNYIECKNLGFKSIDIVDISALPKEVWEKRMKKGDILLFGGGITYHLSDWLYKTNLIYDLKKYLKNRVYVGISTGSMLTAKTLSIDLLDKIFTEEVNSSINPKGLGLVDFEIIPHLNDDYFNKVRLNFIEKNKPKLDHPIYVLDDDSAIQVKDGEVKVISEGEWGKVF
jgi:dipeptidase E